MSPFIGMVGGGEWEWGRAVAEGVQIANRPIRMNKAWLEEFICAIVSRDSRSGYPLDETAFVFPLSL